MHVGEKVEIPVAIDHAGPNIVEIEAEPAPGELTTVNNRAVLTVEGVRENLRVLLVSGEPHAGERTWRNMLKSDASVDLVHFTILRPPEKQDGTPINQLSLIAFPTRELFQEKLDQFDLIIFDRYQRRGVLPLLYLENVAHYVERGGAVLVVGRRRLRLAAQPLPHAARTDPARRAHRPRGRGAVQAAADRARREASGDQRSAGRSGARARPGDAGSAWSMPSPRDAEVLMKGAEDKPLLVLGERGQGRVALLLSDHTWLWARGYEGGGPYTDLLRRLAALADEGARPRRGDAEGDEPRPDAHHRARARSRTTIDPVKRDRALRQGGDDHPRQGRARHFGGKSMTVSEQGVYRVSSGKLASVVTVGNANAARAFGRDRDRQAALAAFSTRPAAAASGSGATRPTLPPAAHRHAARRPCHAWRRLARACTSATPIT